MEQYIGMNVHAVSRTVGDLRERATPHEDDIVVAGIVTVRGRE